MRNRRGRTLVEVLVALVVLTVGLLGAAAAAAGAARLISAGGRQFELAALATAVLEEARTASCGTPTAGTRTVPPFTLTWSVEPGPGVSEIRLLALEQVTPEPRRTAFVAARWCPP